MGRCGSCGGGGRIGGTTESGKQVMGFKYVSPTGQETTYLTNIEAKEQMRKNKGGRVIRIVKG